MFILFNKDEEYLHEITPLKAINKEILNGEDTLELTLFADIEVNKKYKIVTYIEKYNIWKEFIVEEIEEDRIEGTLEIYAESSFYETIGDYVEDKRAIDTTANIGLARVLEPTRWEVGIVDNLGIATETFYHISSKEAVQKIVKTWKGEIRTRIEITGKKITHRYVDILSRRGRFLGERFVTGENINSLKRTIHSDPIATALFGYGKGEEVGDGYGRRLDFADINGGKAYVENDEARILWGRLNPDGTKSHIFGKVDFDDVEDKQELLNATQEELEALSKPKITYEGEIVGSVAELGDTVILIDTTYKPELRLTARVYEIENDLLEEENSKPILGNYIDDITDTLNKQEEYINNFRDKQGVWDRAEQFNKDGTLNSNFLIGLLEEFNNKANSTGGYVFHKEGNGILTIDKPDETTATMAVQIKGGLIRIANSKLSNGNWNWTTAMDGKGIIASTIVAGILKGGKVHFDLENGTLLIGENTSNYTFFWNGTTLKIKGDFEIGEGKVNINKNGIQINDGVFQLTNSNGTVVIDGQSNMHKILATGVMNINVPAGAVTYSASISHNLGYTPAFSAYMQGDNTQPEEDGFSFSLPRLITDPGGSSLVMQSTVIGEATANRFYVRVRRAQDYGSALPAKTIKIRYFIYKEVAF